MLLSALVSALITLLVLALLLMALARWYSVPGHRGPPSDHFDGTRFMNQAATVHSDLGGAMKWMLRRQPGPWRKWTDAHPGPDPPRRVDGNGLRVTFINHTTVLIQRGGVNILTDPIWSMRCSPWRGIGPRRVRPPGLAFEQLPPIDIVLLSHNHYDHLDLASLRRVMRDHSPRLVVPLGNAAFLGRKGMPVARELDWWQQADLGETRITAVPARHFSGRSFHDRDNTLWAGYVISGPAGAVYFAGDTGFGPHFEQVRSRFGAIRLALLPIGAFRPEWFMSRVHISPEDALRAHGIVGASTSVATHFGTFRLADDGQDEAPERLRAACEAAGEPAPRFWVLGFGEGRDVPALSGAAG